MLQLYCRAASTSVPFAGADDARYTASLTLSLVASRSDGTSATVPIPVNVNAVP
jgi:hypothetical protein